MGIGGLLIHTKSIGKRRHIADYRNMRVGVDGYSWLHKSLHICAVEVAVYRNLYKIVRYFEKNLRCMLSLNIRVTIVFDGDKLRLKSLTESARAVSRKRNSALAMESHLAGRGREAHRLFSQAIDITPAMAFFVKQRLEELFPGRLEFLVAPYEADSQLAYLSKTNYIDLVITEDSDLLVFGARRMLYKMDKDFWGVEVELDRLSECEEFSFAGWSHDKFVQLCVLAGCDYLASPKGIAFKKAYANLERYQTIENAIGALFDRIDEDYYDRFLCAYLAFKYARVFCPLKKQLVNLNPFRLEEMSLSNTFDFAAAKRALNYFGSMDFLGKDLDSKTACELAACKIDPIFKAPFICEPDFGFKSDKKDHWLYKAGKKKAENGLPTYSTARKIRLLKLRRTNEKEFWLGQKEDNRINLRDDHNPLQNFDNQVDSENFLKVENLEERNKEKIHVANNLTELNETIDWLIENFKVENEMRKPSLKNVIDQFRYCVNGNRF